MIKDCTEIQKCLLLFLTGEPSWDLVGLPCDLFFICYENSLGYEYNRRKIFFPHLSLILLNHLSFCFLPLFFCPPSFPFVLLMGLHPILPTPCVCVCVCVLMPHPPILTPRLRWTASPNAEDEGEAWDCIREASGLYVPVLFLPPSFFLSVCPSHHPHFLSSALVFISPSPLIWDQSGCFHLSEHLTETDMYNQVPVLSHQLLIFHHKPQIFPRYILANIFLRGSV